MTDGPNDLLTELVRIPSPTGQETAAVKFLVEWMQLRGFRAGVDEIGNAVGVRGPDDAPRTLMLLGHIDTVPGDVPVRVEGGALYGRGAVDAKGSLCALADAAARAQLPEGWRAVVVGAVAEEGDSRGAYWVRDRFEPHACIIGEPSGADRITLGYKGHVWFRYTFTHSVTHSSRPEPSVGALGAAFWQAVLAWCEASNAGCERLFDQVVPHLGSINTDTDGLADTVRLTIGVRLPPRVDPAEVHAALAALAAPDAQLEMDRGVAAHVAGKNNPLVRGMVAAIRVQGGVPGFMLKAGTSDMNVVGERWRCPLIAYGPGDSHLDHTPHEHLPLDEYARAIAVLRHLIEHLEPAPVQADPHRANCTSGT